MADAFIITDVGLVAAANAAEQSIRLVLSTFRVGSAYGYTPTRADTGLHGSTLYSDRITSFRVAPDGSLVATCTMSVDAGPFDFGEIGIYTQEGLLFALAAFATPQTKYSSLSSNIASTYSFDVYIRLGQATTIIEIDSVTSVTYAQIVAALGYVPYDSANPSGFITVNQVPGALYNANLQLFSLGVGVPPSGVQGEIRSNGAIYTTGNIEGFQTSDIRYKENLRPIRNPLSILRQITGYEFEWKDTYIESNGGLSPWLTKTDLSLAAQEVKEVLPIAVYEAEDEQRSLSIRPSKFLPILIESIKALDSRVALLEKLLEDKP